MPLVELTDLERHYLVGEQLVRALAGIDLSISSGEFVAIMGASGSGKSTLMNTLGCLDRPTRGSYFLDGLDILKAAPHELAEIRNRKLGFVFQGFNLLPRTSSVENVELPLLYRRKLSQGKKLRSKDCRQMAIAALERVGLGNRLNHIPSQLSGGQQQRVAIARALVGEPSIILADEPTGNLDSGTSLEIMALFQELNSQGITIIMVTHERDIANFAQRIVSIRDGRILSDTPIAKPANAAQAFARWQSEHEKFLSGQGAAPEHREGL